MQAISLARSLFHGSMDPWLPDERRGFPPPPIAEETGLDRILPFAGDNLKHKGARKAGLSQGDDDRVPIDDAAARRPVLFVLAVVVGDVHGVDALSDRPDKLLRRLLDQVVDVAADAHAVEAVDQRRDLGAGIPQARTGQALDAKANAKSRRRLPEHR